MEREEKESERQGAVGTTGVGEWRKAGVGEMGGEDENIYLPT